MPKDQQLSNEKSLEIIHQAKTNITDSGISWLIWGSMLFLAFLSTYFLINFESVNLFLGWNIFGVITIILLTFDVAKPNRKPVRTYVDDLLRLVDTGFMICIFTIIFSININAVNPSTGFGFFLMIFAFLMLLKGGALRSKALKIGAVVNWTGAIIIFINKDFKNAMLIMSAAVMIGYIIPGLFLRVQYKKTNNFQEN